MAAIWERIEAWYEAQGVLHLLNPGATEDAIASTEKQLGLNFPPQLRESLRRHDGSDSLGWVGGELLSLERIASERQVWMELLESGIFDDSSDHDASEGQKKVQPGWWNAGWIPLHADGGGNGFVVDTAPAAQGQVGQIVFMDHEVGPSGPEYGSLEAYLRAVADALEDGRHIIYDRSVVSIDELNEELEDAP